MKLYFHVPGPVQSKLRHRTAAYQRRDGSLGTVAYAESKTRNYEARVCLFANNAMAGQMVERFSGPVSVSCRFWISIPESRKKRLRTGQWHTQRPDLDNMKKSILDACNKTVFTDDCLVAVIYAEKRWTQSEPGVDICIEDLPVTLREGTRTSNEVLPFAPLLLPVSEK